MPRPALVILAVLAVSAPIAALAHEGVPGLPAVLQDGDDAGDEPGVTRSDDGHEVMVTEEALPGSTGWVLVSVSPAETSEVTIDRAIYPNGSHGHGFAYADYLAFDRQGRTAYEPHAHAGDHGEDEASASLAGRTASCCPRPTNGSGPLFLGSDEFGRDHAFDLTIGENETVTVGLLVTNWTDEDEFRFSLRDRNATLDLVDVQRGTTVEIVDLVDEAHRNGTSLRTNGHNQVSSPGPATVRADLPAHGFVSLESYVQGDRQAKVELSLPNGTVVDNGDGRNVSLEATAQTGPGPIEVTLTDLEDRGRTDEVEPGSEDGFYDVEAEVVVADLPTDTPRLWQEVRVIEGPPEVPDDGHSASFSDAALPASDGWALKEITADEATDLLVRVTYDANDTEAGPSAAVPILVGDDSHARQLHDRGYQRWHGASANVDGEGIACCRLSGFDQVVPHDDSDTTHYEGYRVGPDTPLYVGLAAAGWGEDDRFEVLLHPEVDDSVPRLKVTDVRKGTDVAHVDLVDAATRNGTNAQVLGRQVAGDEGEARFGTQAQDAGLVSLEYHFEGPDARGVLDVSLPDDRRVDNGDGRNVTGEVAGLAGPGPLQVQLTDVQRPSFADAATSHEGSWAEATLFYADVDLPPAFHRLEIDTHDVDGD